MSTDPPVDQNPERLESVRPTFYAELEQRCVQFANDVMALIPEVETIAIIPALKLPNADIPAGYLVGRDGPPKTPVEVMHLASQLHRAQQHLLGHAAAFLKYLDQELAEAMRQLHEKRHELDGSDAPNPGDPAAQAAERGSTAGAPPNGPGPSGDPTVGPATDR